jgi:hypothetical protein
MFETNFLIPTGLAPIFVEDLTAWANTRAVEPRLSTVASRLSDESGEAHRRYRVFVDESFFVEKPQWTLYIEH